MVPLNQICIIKPDAEQILEIFHLSFAILKDFLWRIKSVHFLCDHSSTLSPIYLCKSRFLIVKGLLRTYLIVYFLLFDLIYLGELSKFKILFFLLSQLIFKLFKEGISFDRRFIICLASLQPNKNSLGRYFIIKAICLFAQGILLNLFYL
jgi:hypothetical protein